MIWNWADLRSIRDGFKPVRAPIILARAKFKHERAERADFRPQD